jgi:hypothetical protein
MSNPGVRVIGTSALIYIFGGNVVVEKSRVDFEFLHIVNKFVQVLAVVGKLIHCHPCFLRLSRSPTATCEQACKQERCTCPALIIAATCGCVQLQARASEAVAPQLSGTD